MGKGDLFMSTREKKLLSYILVAVMILGGIGHSSVVSYATGENEAGNGEAVEQNSADNTTEAVTEAPTEAATETPTEATTEKATNNKTEKKSSKSSKKTTEKATEATGNTGDNGVTDASVQKAREDAKEAEDNLNAAQKILDSLKDTKNNLENYVTQLDKSINELQVEMTNLEMSQKELEASIEETKDELAKAQRAQERQYDQMKKRIQMVYESGNKTYLDVILTATSMSDMLNKSEYVTCVSMYDYTLLKKLENARKRVGDIKQKLDMDLVSNKELQKQVNAQKETIETLVAEKKEQITQYNESIAGQEKEVQKYMNAKAEAESIIAAAEASAAAAANDGTVYTGGAFTWPAPGNYTITSYFGGRESPVPGASSNHMGIDIAVSTGDPIVAAADGTVIVATYNYAEGNDVCIDHGGGVVTLYMHNSSLAVSVGDQVVAGQTIAYAGSTGISTGPHCHFGVRINGSYVDPITYLQ